MIPILSLVLVVWSAPAVLAQSTGDTLWLEVGSTAVNGRIFAPHAARVRVHIGSDDGSPTSEWTNELTIGDSAGRPIMRWVTLGTRRGADGAAQTWELRQTYDLETLAPYAYSLSVSNGAAVRLTFEGRRVRGVRRSASDTTEQIIDLALQRPGFIASASDLVPLAVGLREGAIIVAPLWGPAMTDSEMRVFTVLGRTPTTVEGREWSAWKVEERRLDDGRLLATWYLVEESPYMVYGEVPLPDGRLQRMTEVAIPRPSR